MAVAMLLGVTCPVAATALEAQDRDLLRSMVTRQIDAFKRDDAGAAYAFTSPGLRQAFPTEQDFLAMVQRGYPQVYRPRSYTFGPDREAATGPELSLRIQDEAGADWDAVYSFERQSDGAWTISGCRLVKAPGESV